MYNKQFAKVYNTEWRDFSILLADKILSLTNKRYSLLDLGCGTGNLLQKVENQFEKTVGVDISKPMIDIAKKNCKKTKFIVDDVTKFSLNEKFDIITCTYDMINHLNAIEDWQTLFSNVFNHLNKHGVFFFDFNTSYMMKSLVYNQDLTKQTKNFNITFQNKKCDKNHILMNLKIYNRSNKFLTEVNEIESFFNENKIITCLKKAGFTNFSFVDKNFIKLSTYDTFKIFVICKK